MRFARQVHGNQSIEKTTENALRITQFYKVPVPVYVGAAKPMLRPAKHCAEIHGSTGLDSIDGSHGLPPCSDEFMADWETRYRRLKAVPEMFRAIRAEFEERKTKVTIVATGSLTNVALCIAVYGDDLREAVEGIVFMGGSVREGGNTGVQTEFNMQVRALTPTSAPPSSSDSHSHSRYALRSFVRSFVRHTDGSRSGAARDR